MLNQNDFKSHIINTEPANTSLVQRLQQKWEI